MKKYKIVQSLKATRKLSTDARWFSYLKDMKIQKFIKDPTNKSFITRIAFYTLFTFIFFLFTGSNLDKIMPYPNEYMGKTT